MPELAGDLALETLQTMEIEIRNKHESATLDSWIQIRMTFFYLRLEISVRGVRNQIC